MRSLAGLVAALAILTMPCWPGGGQGRKYESAVYYSQMLANRSEALTPGTIEGQYDLTSCLNKHIRELVSLLRREDGSSDKLDESQIRLKVVLPDSVILLDLYGNVREGGKLHKIDRETQKAIRRLILSQVPDG